MWDDGLDEIDWGALEDAYGPAVDVPDQLRMVAAGGEQWEEGLAALDAGVFHQGSCFDATPIAVRYLIRLLEGAPEAPVAMVLAFLGRFGMGHESDAAVGFDPFAFRSAPPSADYPEGAATVEAVAKGVDVYARLLEHPDPDVRASAAYVLGGLANCPPGVVERVRGALRGETDVGAKASLALAWGRVGSEVAELTPLLDADAPVVRGAAAVAAAWLGRAADELLRGRLSDAALDSEASSVAPWGDEGGLPALAISVLGRAGERQALEAALLARLARGDRPLKHAVPEPGQAYVAPTAEALATDAALRALATVYAPLGFPELSERDELALPSELDSSQRTLLLQTARAELPLPIRAIPWSDLGVLERFLADGDGPLEANLELPDGRRDVIWRALYRVADHRCPVEQVTPVLDAVLAQYDGRGVLALCLDLLSGAYPHYAGSGRCFPIRKWGPLLERLERDAEELEPELLKLAHARVEFDSARAELLARPLFALAKRRGTLLDPALDEGLWGALYSPEKAWSRELLRALPMERRCAWVGRLRNAYTIQQFVDLCDRDAVKAHVLESLNGWDRHREQARQLLTQLFSAEELRMAIAARIDKAASEDEVLRHLEYALRALTPEHRLEVARSIAGLECVFRAANGDELDRLSVGPHPKIEDLEPLFEELPDALRVVFEMDDHTLGYRLQRLLSELGIPSVRFGNSSIECG